MYSFLKMPLSSVTHDGCDLAHRSTFKSSQNDQLRVYPTNPGLSQNDLFQGNSLILMH